MVYNASQVRIYYRKRLVVITHMGERWGSGVGEVGRKSNNCTARTCDDALCVPVCPKEVRAGDETRNHRQCPVTVKIPAHETKRNTRALTRICCSNGASKKNKNPKNTLNQLRDGADAGDAAPHPRISTVPSSAGEGKPVKPSIMLRLVRRQQLFACE